jgi:hypothetical protein
VARSQQHDQAGTDLAEPVEAQGVVVTLPPAMQSLMDWCVEYATRTDEDEWSAMEASVARILQGEDAASVLEEDAPLQAQELCTKVGRTPDQRVSPVMLLDGFTLTATDYSEGWPFYANMDVTIQPGNQRKIVNCGGIKVVAKLRMLAEFGEWPLPITITADKTKKGNTVLDIVTPKIV